MEFGFSPKNNGVPMDSSKWDSDSHFGKRLIADCKTNCRGGSACGRKPRPTGGPGDAGGFHRVVKRR